MMNVKLILVAIAILVVIAAVGAYWKFGPSKTVPIEVETLSAPPDAPSLGEALYEEAANPVKNVVPETNPFSGETNPLKAIYKNPFE